MAFASKDLSLLGGFRHLCSGIDFRRKPTDPPRPSWSTETGYSPKTQTRTFLRGLGSLSVKHPIIVITGSSGAGTSTVRTTFEEIFRREGLTPALTGVSAAEFGARAKRPAYSVLAHRALRALGHPDLPSWKDGLAAYLAERRAVSATAPRGS